MHLYQPANADDGRIIEATKKSYERIVRGLEEHPWVKFTMNISGCLVLRWAELGRTDLIERIKRLVAMGQIELTGTVAYHPLLPLTHKREIVKQVKENEKILKKYFGQSRPKGFFSPEMAYGVTVAKLIKKLGYKWIILDEMAAARAQDFLWQQIYKDKASDLKVIFRSRKFSGSYVPDFLNNLTPRPPLLRKEREEAKRMGEVIITATDGELYGLRHEDPTGEFEKLLKNKKIKTKLISDYISGFKNIDKIKLRPSNWESTEEELKKKSPYFSWRNKKSKIQKKIWQLAELSYEIVESREDDENYQWARWHLVRGLASCTFWWASEKDFSHIFGPFAWSPDEIERGVNELIRSVRSLHDSTARKTKMKAEKIYAKIKEMVWTRHWKIHE